MSVETHTILHRLLLLSTALLMCLMQSSLAATELSIEDVANAITQNARDNRFPSQSNFSSSSAEISQTGYIQYTFDPQIHDDMASVYLKYQPDYACFVAIDVDTGAILNLTSFIKSDEQWDNLVMRSDYPAASVFKIVTASAGIDLGKVTPETVIPFNGKSTTLYKSQVLRHKNNKWTRTPSFKEAFAKSINPVFAQLGVFRLGASNLTNYAERFGFDNHLITDFNLPQSRVGLDFDTEWEIAEAASGYTKDVTLSPIHAAQLAAIIANDGKSVVPYMVDNVTNKNGKILYKANLNVSKQIISAATAKHMRGLMVETTRIGSARSSFRGLSKYKIYKGMEIGGKTGSLTGFSPKGRHDWFVGFAKKGDRRVAYASLIINKEKWTVRSAYVARQFIYNYFSKLEQDKQLAASG